MSGRPPPRWETSSPGNPHLLRALPGHNGMPAAHRGRKHVASRLNARWIDYTSEDAQNTPKREEAEESVKNIQVIGITKQNLWRGNPWFSTTRYLYAHTSDVKDSICAVEEVGKSRYNDAHRLLVVQIVLMNHQHGGYKRGITVVAPYTAQLLINNMKEDHFAKSYGVPSKSLESHVIRLAMNEERTLIASYPSEKQIAMSKGDLYDLIEDGSLDPTGEEVEDREWEVERIGDIGLNATPVVSNQFWTSYHTMAGHSSQHRLSSTVLEQLRITTLSSFEGKLPPHGTYYYQPRRIWSLNLEQTTRHLWRGEYDSGFVERAPRRSSSTTRTMNNPMTSPTSSYTNT
ncbi:hypothetical protein CDV55_100513 [Aspergillus turcosus]|nr:hypothetical protein CDV55_100513 [Aspergillus turcosus]